MRRRVIAAAALAVVLPVQLTIVNGMALPGGGVPDLMLVVVIAFGLTGGPVTGTVTGFAAGLALDLAPPATQPLGQYALVFCLAGYLAGRFRPALCRSALTALGGAALAAAGGEVLAAGLALALDSPEATMAVVARVLPWSILYDVALTPLAVLVVVRVAVAVGATLGAEPEPLAAEPGGSAGPAVHRRPEVTSELAGRLLGRTGSGSAAGVAAAAATMAEAGGGAGTGALVSWLAGPAGSRRDRKLQERSAGRLIGRPRKGGADRGREGGAAPAAVREAADRLRPQAGVPGSAARAFRLVPRPAAREPRLRLGRDSRDGGADRGGGARRTGPARGGSVLGAGGELPRIAFGGDDPRRAGAREGRPAGLPRIAFGSGSGLARGGGARSFRSREPKISFGGQSRAMAAVMAAASWGIAASGGARASWGIAASGGARASGTARAGAAGARSPRSRRISFAAAAPGPARARRRRKEPGFSRIPAPVNLHPARRPPGKVARFSAGRRRAVLARRLENGLPGWLPRWLTGRLLLPGRPGGRSAVWRIGTRRIGGYR